MYKILIPLFFIFACQNEPSYDAFYEKFCEPSKERAEWVTSCAKAANPMSDEEGEDLVAQCASSSKDLFCSHQWVSIRYNNSNYRADEIPCDLIKEPIRVQVCVKAGWKPK